MKTAQNFWNCWPITTQVLCSDAVSIGIMVCSSISIGLLTSFIWKYRHGSREITLLWCDVICVSFCRMFVQQLIKPMKISKFCITAPLWREWTDGFPSQRASNAGSVSMLVHRECFQSVIICMAWSGSCSDNRETSRSCIRNFFVSYKFCVYFKWN